jgi:hypothetical protein
MADGREVPEQKVGAGFWSPWLIRERQEALALVEPPRIIILCIDNDGEGAISLRTDPPGLPRLIPTRARDDAQVR